MNGDQLDTSLTVALVCNGRKYFILYVCLIKYHTFFLAEHNWDTKCKDVFSTFNMKITNVNKSLFFSFQCSIYYLICQIFFCKSLLQNIDSHVPALIIIINKKVYQNPITLAHQISIFSFNFSHNIFPQLKSSVLEILFQLSANNHATISVELYMKNSF